MDITLLLLWTAWALGVSYAGWVATLWARDFETWLGSIGMLVVYAIVVLITAALLTTVAPEKRATVVVPDTENGSPRAIAVAGKLQGNGG